MNESPPSPETSPELKKPSVVSQLVPYLFTAAILVWVFTGLSSNVVDERHVMRGREWSELRHRGIKPASLKVQSADGAVSYCVGRDAGTDGGDCPAGGDYELRPETKAAPAALRRTVKSRIPDGAEVRLNYVKKVKLREVAALVQAADLRLFLPLMILHVVVFFLADTFSFGLAYRWFHVPGMKFREIMECRAAPYVIQVGLAPLAEVLFPLYMWRVKKAPVTEILSSNLWTIILDTAAVFSVITPAVAFNLFGERLVPAVGGGWLAACGVFWILFFGNLLFWHSRWRTRASAWIAAGKTGDGKNRLQNFLGNLLQLLRTFSLARWHHYLRVYLIRLVLACSSLISNYFALRALGVDPPLPLAFISIPIIVAAVFLPISVGGYGGPQLIAWLLIVEMGKTGTADQVIAFSILWSTCFLIGRAAIGLVFIRGFWKRCFPRGFRL